MCILFPILHAQKSASKSESHDSDKQYRGLRLAARYICAPQVVENSHGKTLVLPVQGSVSAVARARSGGENQAAIITWSTHREMKRQRYTCSNKKATLRQSVSDHPLAHLRAASGGHLQTICHYRPGGESEMCAERFYNRKIQQTLKGCAI
jgi:hypothetical protein